MLINGRAIDANACALPFLGCHLHDACHGQRLHCCMMCLYLTAVTTSSTKLTVLDSMDEKTRGTVWTVEAAENAPEDAALGTQHPPPPPPALNAGTQPRASGPCPEERMMQGKLCLREPLLTSCSHSRRVLCLGGPIPVVSVDLPLPFFPAVSCLPHLL